MASLVVVLAHHQVRSHNWPLGSHVEGYVVNGRIGMSNLQCVYAVLLFIYPHYVEVFYYGNIMLLVEGRHYTIGCLHTMRLCIVIV